MYAYVYTCPQLMNSEYPSADLQNDPADTEVHELIFTSAGISGFPSHTPRRGVRTSPGGAFWGPAVRQRETSHQVTLGGQRGLKLHARNRFCAWFCQLPSSILFSKIFLKPHCVNDTVVFTPKLMSRVWKTKLGAFPFVKPRCLKQTGRFSLLPRDQ